MKLKITLQREGRPETDLLVTLEVGATVADLAEVLATDDPRLRAPGRTRPDLPVGPAGNPPRPHLRVVEPYPVDLDPDAAVAGSGLRSGMTVRLVDGPRSTAPTGSAVLAVLLRVTAGPDLGREFRLPRGTSVIGRDAGCAVRLSDHLVSRRHAQITVGEKVELTDLGSTNGLELGSGTVARATLRTGDAFRVGDTELTVEQAGQGDPAGRPGAEAEGFNRPPRLSPVYPGEQLSAPQPPAPAKAARIPIIPLFTPLLLGAVLYFTTHSATSLVFVGLSPLMAVGYAVETGRSTRREFRREGDRFRADLAALVEQARDAAAREVDVRRREHPSVADCAEAIRKGTALLWARRPQDPGFGELRLATGTLPSRSTIARPDVRTGDGALTAELERAVAPFATVDGVPVPAAPGEHGAIGLVGDRPTALGVARGLVIQAVALHSPAQLLISAFVSARTAADWDWLKWLPHATAGQGQLPGLRLAASAGDAGALLTTLETAIAERAAAGAGTPAGQGAGAAPPLILVVVEDDTAAERSRLVALAEQGREHGVYVLWLAGRLSRLPAACRIFAAVDRAGGQGGAVGTAGFADAALSLGPLDFEALDADSAHELALQLSPRIDTGARGEDASDLPRSVPLIAVGGQQPAVSAEAVIERWSQSRSILTGDYAPPPDAPRKAGTLRAVIGTSAGGTHALDLRADGPHALVGGTTGSGKSELLQSWILALAAAHSPQRLTFLLVDYKGGSAFGDLKHLPHTVGLVTDLDQHEVRRSLVSLAAELHRRERYFATFHAKDLVELESRRGTEPPPSLVIVVDEFAALVKELPEFVDGVVNVAQRGRSLGVHLILATQRPAGVISDNLRANTNLRLALRMADEADSLDVLGSREAAYFDLDLPGRAVSKTGPGRLVPFQVGYAGGWTPAQPVAPQIAVEPLCFGAGEPWPRRAAGQSGEPGPTDLQRVVHAIRQARVEAGLPVPRRPWLDPLGQVYDLADPGRFPHTGEPNSLVFALGDHPERQEQRTVHFRPDDGNLAVYGTGGSGKSTVLRTLVAAAGRVATIDPTHVYGLDFGSRGLAMLEVLPHVGNIIGGADHELTARLLRWLRELVAERAERYAKAEVSSITEYRRTAGPQYAAEPRILLLVDGMSAFRQVYETSDRDGVFENFGAIAAAGRPVGVHVLVTADRAAAIPYAVASSMQTRLVLRLADPNEYAMLGAPPDVLKPGSPAGRGLLHRTELQVAVLGGSTDVSIQANYVRRLANTMARSGAAPAPVFERIREKVALDSLPSSSGGRPVLGLRVADLTPQTFAPTGSFLVVGAPGSGRTSALRTLAHALRRWDPLTELHFFAPRASELTGLPLWTTAAEGPQAAADLAEQLLQQRAADPADRPAAMFVEGYTEFGPAEPRLADLARAFVAARCLLVAESESSVTGGSPTGLQAPAKSGRTGLSLAPLQTDGFTFFRTGFGRTDPADFPPGRALFVAGGRTVAVQIAWTDEP